VRRSRGAANSLMACGFVALCVSIGAVLVAPAAASADSGAKTTLPEIESQVMCPICGTLLELADSPQADRERAFIRRELAAGKSEQQIKDDLVAQYGDEVLATPPASGFDLSAYLVPAIAIVAVAIAIALGVWRWRRSGRRGPPGGPGGRRLDSKESERLDADLARYEL
jgi:cytochrome c-type biogenesis protein CcmH